MLVCLCALGIWTEKEQEHEGGAVQCFLSKEKALHTVKRLENVAFGTVAPKMLPCKLSASEKEREREHICFR